MVVLVLSMMASATAMAQDWGIFELKGKVKSVTYDWCCPFNGVASYDDAGQVVKFNTSGRVIVPEDGKIVRNNMGTAIDIQFYICEGEIEDWLNQKLVYDSEGRLQKVDTGGYECERYTKFVYDGEGNVTKKVDIEEADGDIYTMVTTYTYVSFDAQGNWTKRVATTTCDWADTETNTEVRTILYY